jgi:hypothetical protein
VPVGSTLNISGHITFLRVHDVGTGFGRPPNVLDGEVACLLDSAPQGAFGFQLRNDANELVREAMAGLLRDAYVNDLKVSVDYFIDPGKHNGRAFRIALVR